MFSGIVSGDIENIIETSNHNLKTSSRQQSEDLIFKQIDAFERLLQHSMSRFSKENLYHMLTHVTRWADEETRAKTRRESKVAFKLKSIDQLREVVGSVKNKRKGRNSADDLVFKHYELFLNDLMYLKDLKKYFDDEIHTKLQTYHFNVASYDDVRFQDMENSNTTSIDRFQDMRTSSEHAQLFTSRTDDRDSGRGSQSELYEHKQSQHSVKQKRKLECQRKLKQTVEELDMIRKKWQGLLTEDTLELNDFDPDSYHELMQFTHYSQFEPLLRLIPDIFAKCYKCIDLSKRWLEDANGIFKESPITSTPLPEEDGPEPFGLDPNPAKMEQSQKEYMKQIKDLKSQIDSMNKTIEESELELTRYNSEMDVLVGRDERFQSVSSEFDKIDSLITIAAGDYQTSKTEQYTIASKLRGCRKGSQTYTELKSHLKRLDTAVSQNHWKIKLLEFEKATVQEDYLLGLEVRPSFIRFVGDTKEKIQDLEDVLRSRKEEKLKLEKQLALTKTNTERMRAIMRSFLGSATSSMEGRSRTFDSSPRSPSKSENTEDDLFLDTGRTDGNEADEESSSVLSGDGKEDTDLRIKVTSPSDDVIMQTPRLVKNKQSTKRDLRPLSESNAGQPRVRLEQNTQRTTCSKGPRAALKTQPKRVWELV